MVFAKNSPCLTTWRHCSASQRHGSRKTQCLIRIVAAGCLVVGGIAPAKAEVDAAARSLREQLAWAATEALRAMGDAPDRVPAAEAELRAHCHDLVHAGHDKDFRVLAVLPTPSLRALRLTVVHLDHSGGIIVEPVSGEEATHTSPRVWVLIHRGHMRLLIPRGTGPDTWVGQQSVTDTPAYGWEWYFDRCRDQPATSPGDPTKQCRCCRAAKYAQDPRPRLVGEEEDLGSRAGSVLAAAALTPFCLARVGSVGPTYTVRGPQLRLIEVCAGTAGITKAWLAKGFAAEEPIELYEHPGRQEGPRPHMDVRRADVQQRLLAAAAHPEGPNVWVLEPPCTSFSDWQIHNGGTRTYC